MTTSPEPRWIKSTFSAINGNCVEVAMLAGGNVGVRDSKDPQGPVLEFAAAEWAQLLSGIRSGSPAGTN